MLVTGLRAPPEQSALTSTPIKKYTFTTIPTPPPPPPQNPTRRHTLESPKKREESLAIPGLGASWGENVLVAGLRAPLDPTPEPRPEAGAGEGVTPTLLAPDMDPCDGEGEIL